MITLPICAQQNTVATGGDANGTNGSVSFSVGQIDYTTSSGTDGIVSEGVQQPFEFYDPDAGLTEQQLSVSLFPNPTNEFVIVQIPNWDASMRFALIDSKGSIVLNGTISDEKTTLDMRTLSAGSYQLQVTSDQQALRTLQIIKN